jgi:hypothetical protein
MKNIIMCLILSFILVAAFTVSSLAGHHYHGCGMTMKELSDLDSNQDGTLSFDEFSAPQTERLQSAFNMLDMDDDGVISELEWREFLKIHGFDVESEG